MKNSKTEFIPHSVNHLRKQLSEFHKTSAIQKSEDYSSGFIDIAKQFVEDSVEMYKAAKNLNSLFLILKNDFDNGQINFAMYKDLLKPLYELLMEGENGGKEPINVRGLDTAAIVKELKRVGY